MKHSKFLGVLAATLCLGLGGLASCTPAEDQPAGTSEKHVHKAADGAEWKNDDNNHWHECEAGDGGIVDKAKHTFDETKAKTITEATCTEAGSEEVTCTVCGKTVTRTVKAKGHTYEKENGEDKVTWTKQATCEEGGEGTKECTVCHTKTPVTSDPKGHTYEKVKDESGADTNEDKVIWLKEATCVDSGLGYKVCTECNKAEEVIADPLGHEFITTDTAEPEEGKATVRTYTCKNGCGKSYLGFKATEVSTSCKSGLVEETDSATGEKGYRFWGRPIGNAVALDDSGTADRDNHDPIFDRTVEGDLFEYVFDLSEEQAALLSDVRLFCNAKAADYLSGKDFWACDPNGEEWTPGFYIDQAPEHLNEDGTGKRIDDYRYILYVDDQVVSFDPTMSAPVTGSQTNQPRKDYMMPYAFHLHAGTNKISLRMAGGYRSTFFSFTFRTVEEEEQGVVLTAHHWGADTAIAADTTKGTVAAKKATDSSTNEVKYEIKLDDSMMAADSYNKNDPAGYVKLNGNGQSLSFKFETDAALTGKIYQRGVMDGWSSNKGKHLFTSNGQASGSDNLELKVNSTAIDLSSYKAKKFEDVMVEGTAKKSDGTSLNLSANTLVECGTVSLVAGVNEVSYKRLGSYNLALTDIVFIGTPAATPAA